MGKFLSDMFKLGSEALIAFPSSKKRVSEVTEFLQSLIIDNKEIEIEEFIKMYDMRIHDFATKQNDIKILKQLDFEGVYVIHNCTKDIFCVGKSKRVLRKVDRYFRGYENEEVYADYEDGDEFKVKIIKYEDSNYDNIDELLKEKTNEYGKYIVKEDRKKVQKKNIKKNKKENKSTKQSLLSLFGIYIIIILFCLLILYICSTPRKGEIKVTINAKDYIGINYEQVEEKFKDMGFTNIKTVPEEDLITGWINKEGQTDKITIDDNSKFEEDDIFSKDAEVVITYHSFKNK